jgi:hypothetical protein
MVLGSLKSQTRLQEPYESLGAILLWLSVYCTKEYGILVAYTTGKPIIDNINLQHGH